MGAFLAIGLVFAFFSSEEYSSSASVIPEYELQDRVNEVIESYGLLFGLTGSTRENRTPSYLLELYPYMINSVAFKYKLMHKPFEYAEQDTTITMYQYFTNLYQPSVLHNLYSYITGPSQPEPDTTTQTKTDTGADPGLTGGGPAGTGLQLEVPILNFSPDERKVINKLSERITAGFQRSTGIVRVSASMPESDLAAKLVKLTLQTLHEEAGNYKTAKARLYRDFLETQQSQSKQELKEARRELIEFNNAGSQPLNQRMELQSNYEISLDHYNTLTQQLKRIELNIQEQMPSFRLLDDITVPSKQVKPKRKLIILLSILLGLFAAVSWITASFILTKANESS